MMAIPYHTSCQEAACWVRNKNGSLFEKEEMNGNTYIVVEWSFWLEVIPSYNSKEILQGTNRRRNKNQRLDFEHELEEENKLKNLTLYLIVSLLLVTTYCSQLIY